MSRLQFQGDAEPTPFDDGALYDVLFDRMDYGIAYYVQLAREAKGPVLDVACGTGRTLLPCLEAGADVDGLDLSAPMLERLRIKAEAKGFKPHVQQANMSSFEMPRRYALIMIPFNAFVHNLTTTDQIATLECCRKHLLPGGMLVFDTFFPGAALITAPDGQREMEIEVVHPSTGLPIRLYDTRRFNRVEQIQNSECEVEFLDASGKPTEVRRSKTTIRWIYLYEMELLLRIAGFAHWRILGGFDRHPLKADNDAMIVEAWVSQNSA